MVYIYINRYVARAGRVTLRQFGIYVVYMMAALELTSTTNSSQDALSDSNGSSRKFFARYDLVKCALNEIDVQLKELEKSFRDALARPDIPIGRTDVLSSDILNRHRDVTEQFENLKSQPESSTDRNKRHVEIAERRLKNIIDTHQRLCADFRRGSQTTTERLYHIARSDTGEQEVKEPFSDSQAPISQQVVC